MRLGRLLFEVLGVPRDRVRAETQGTPLEDAVVRDLRTVRPDLRIERSQQAYEFAQYAHLAVPSNFLRHRSGVRAQLERIRTCSTTYRPDLDAAASQPR